MNSKIYAGPWMRLGLLFRDGWARPILGESRTGLDTLIYIFNGEFILHYKFTKFIEYPNFKFLKDAQDCIDKLLMDHFNYEFLDEERYNKLSLLK